MVSKANEITPTLALPSLPHDTPVTAIASPKIPAEDRDKWTPENTLQRLGIALMTNDKSIAKEINSLPPELPYHDKKSKKGQHKVGPDVYLFNPRGVTFQTSEAAQSISDGYSLWAKIEFSESLRKWCEDDVKMRTNTSFADSDTATTSWKMYYVYDLVRQSSPALAQYVAYEFRSLPQHVSHALLKECPKATARAREIIKQDPPLFCGYQTFGEGRKGYTPSGGFQSGWSKDYSHILKSTRLSNGELAISDPLCSSNEAVFSPSLEFSLSPMTKFFFRRGLVFIERAEQICKAAELRDE
jgi:hypothetical protein